MPTVAVIGASRDPSKYGNKAVRAYLRQGWTVYPVNPNDGLRGLEIEGVPAVADLDAIPGRVDRVALYVPPEVGITLLPAIAAKGADEVYVNPGAESDELLIEAERLGLPVILACAIGYIGERP